MTEMNGVGKTLQDQVFGVTGSVPIPSNGVVQLRVIAIHALERAMQTAVSDLDTSLPPSSDYRRGWQDSLLWLASLVGIEPDALNKPTPVSLKDGDDEK